LLSAHFFLSAAEDCFLLGQVAYNAGDYYHTILWMTEALRVVDTETIKTANKALTLDYLSYAVYMVMFAFRSCNE
jgi:prolyl 4-hydroxylase